MSIKKSRMSVEEIRNCECDVIPSSGGFSILCRELDELESALSNFASDLSHKLSDFMVPDNSPNVKGEERVSFDQLSPAFRGANERLSTLRMVIRNMHLDVKRFDGY